MTLGLRREVQEAIGRDTVPVPVTRDSFWAKPFRAATFIKLQYIVRDSGESPSVACLSLGNPPTVPTPSGNLCGPPLRLGYVHMSGDSLHCSKEEDSMGKNDAKDGERFYFIFIFTGKRPLPKGKKKGKGVLDASGFLGHTPTLCMEPRTSPPPSSPSPFVFVHWASGQRVCL